VCLGGFPNLNADSWVVKSFASERLHTRCRSELDSVLKNYDLDNREKDAVKNWSVRALYDMGINPLLLLTSSMAMGTDIRA
jgi:hypothetical protein